MTGFFGNAILENALAVTKKRQYVTFEMCSTRKKIFDSYNEVSSLQVQNLKTPAYIVFKDIVRREGAGALYNGLKPTLIRTIPATATMFVTIEYTKKLMYNYF